MCLLTNIMSHGRWKIALVLVMFIPSHPIVSKAATQTKANIGRKPNLIWRTLTGDGFRRLSLTNDRFQQCHASLTKTRPTNAIDGLSLRRDELSEQANTDANNLTNTEPCCSPHLRLLLAYHRHLSIRPLLFILTWTLRTDFQENKPTPHAFPLFVNTLYCVSCKLGTRTSPN